MLWSPTIRAALLAGSPWLDVFCPDCGTSRAIDLRTVDRHPLASVGTMVLGLRCSGAPADLDHSGHVRRGLLARPAPPIAQRFGNAGDVEIYTAVPEKLREPASPPHWKRATGPRKAPATPFARQAGQHRAPPAPLGLRSLAAPPGMQVHCQRAGRPAHRRGRVPGPWGLRAPHRRDRRPGGHLPDGRAECAPAGPQARPRGSAGAPATWTAEPHERGEDHLERCFSILKVALKVETQKTPYLLANLSSRLNFVLNFQARNSDPKRARRWINTIRAPRCGCWRGRARSRVRRSAGEVRHLRRRCCPRGPACSRGF
jgi:hypothetical protein